MTLTRHLAGKSGVNIVTEGSTGNNLAATYGDDQMCGYMTMAAVAFVDYRRKINALSQYTFQQSATCETMTGQHANYHAMDKNEVHTMAFTLKNKVLTDVMMLPLSTAIMKLDEGDRAVATGRFLHPSHNTPILLAPTRVRTFGYNAMTNGFGANSWIYVVNGGGDVTIPTKDYYKELDEQMRKDMYKGSASIKLAHNVIMNTSLSGGANVTHFPNYHISRCNPLREEDKKKSASSIHGPTWIVQQLASMMPLNPEICKNMMGEHEVTPLGIIGEAEIMTGVVPPAPVTQGISYTAQVAGITID